jgi:hypothetical protein
VVILQIGGFYETILKGSELNISFGTTSATKNSCRGIELIDLAHDGDKKAVMNLLVP